MVEVERGWSGDGQTPFVSKLIKEANWEDEVDFNMMWNKMADCIRHVAKEELGESKGMVLPDKDTSWWNEEVKRTIKNKQMCYKNLSKNRDEMSFENYKIIYLASIPSTPISDQTRI